MKKFILGLIVGITIAASYFLLFANLNEARFTPKSENDSADTEQTRSNSTSDPLAYELPADRENQAAVIKNTVSSLDSPSQQSKGGVSEHEDSKYTDSQFYLDEYDQELRTKIDTLSERLDLSELQKITLEKKLLSQKEDLIKKVGEEYLDHIMIDEFSIGLEDDLTEAQTEKFYSYKQEKIMYTATVSGEALVSSVKASTGISKERADELQQALIASLYENSMSGQFTDPFGFIKNYLTPTEWKTFTSTKN